jgi:hypothetical protein
MFAPRLTPWDEVAPDEELPDYEADAAPSYDDTTFNEPFVTYGLRQYDRKIQMLVAYGAADRSSYRITTNAFRMFSKKPHMEVLYTSQEMRQRNIGQIRLDIDGPLPWCPRAHFDYHDSNGVPSTYKMKAPDSANPMSLVLREKTSSVVLARFTYSVSSRLYELHVRHTLTWYMHLSGVWDTGCARRRGWNSPHMAQRCHDGNGRYG